MASGGSSYVCILAHTNHVPPNATYWSLLASKGDTGAQGQQGIPGNEAAWPVGSIFFAGVSTNPASLLGFGTWAAYAAGRVLVGFDATQTEFDLVEETGGEKTHVLTTAEIPAHAHPQNLPSVQTGSFASGTRDTSAGGTGGSPTSVADALSTANAGGGGAHNNLQPYIVVYVWKRTA